MPAGQGMGAIRALTPAAEIVRSMVAEAEAVLAASDRWRGTVG
jgi:NAD(P)H-dependent flavin oxidoreductase YrpB (nitropropane dioxygenase family)